MFTVDQEAFQCPACLDVLKPTLFQCSAGHVFCSSCLDRLQKRDKCLVCSATISYGCCYTIERILRSLRVDCPNCHARMPLNEQDEHAKECTHGAVLQRRHGVGAGLPADRFVLVLPETARGSTTTITISIGDSHSEAIAAEDDKGEKTKVMPGRYVPRWKRGSSAGVRTDD